MEIRVYLVCRHQRALRLKSALWGKNVRDDVACKVRLAVAL